VIPELNDSVSIVAIPTSFAGLFSLPVVSYQPLVLVGYREIQRPPLDKLKLSAEV